MTKAVKKFIFGTNIGWSMKVNLTAKLILSLLWVSVYAGYFMETTFYPTALNGCWGIVFTHGVRMGGRVGRPREIVCPGCISETVRCRKLILGTDIG